MTVNYVKSNSTRMNHKVRFFRKEQAKVKDILGQYPMLETHVCTVWAQILPAGGNSVSSYAETVIASSTHKIVIRYRNDITADMWLLDDLGNRYEITYISQRYDKSDVLEIMAVVNNA